MQFSTPAFLAANTLSSTLQTPTQVPLSSFPQCTINAALHIFATTGRGTNTSCVCWISNIFIVVGPAVQAACSPADFQRAAEDAIQECSHFGITISILNFPSGTLNSSLASSSPKTSAAQSVFTYSTASSISSSTSTSVPPSDGTPNVAAAPGAWAAGVLLSIGVLLVAL